MQRVHSTLKDILKVMSSNIISLLSGIINGLMVPYVLGVSGYGYYRTFILYSTYTALLHCGLIDGIILKFGGIKYSKLNKRKFRSVSRAFILLQFIFTIVFFLLSFVVSNHFYSILCITLGINLFIYNVMTYYIYIAQATMHFGMLSARNVCQSIAFMLINLILCVLYHFKFFNNINYITFILAIPFIYLFMLIWYLYTYREITFGNCNNLRYGLYETFKLCKVGIYLTISYQISSLILMIDNQFVSSFFSAHTYGIYSFSYNVASEAIVILSAVSTVLLPHLKQDTFNHMIEIYPKMISYMMICVYFSLLVYFPLTFVIKLIFSQYIYSLSYLKIFLPELGMTCCVTMIIFNYYNALSKSKFYFYMSIIILIISAVIDSIIYVLFHNPLLIAFGSFIALIIWYIASEHFLIKWYRVKWIKNFIYMILMIFLFFMTSLLNNIVLGFICYLIIYIIISIIMFKKIIRNGLYMVLKHVYKLFN